MAKKQKKITRKRVQAVEDKPFVPPPDVDPKPDIDNDPWGDDGLTTRQRAFVEALVGPAGGNATKAAELAGYRADNRKVLAVTASENLRKPNVSEAIARALARRKLTPQWAREQLADLAQSSMTNFLSVDDKGNATLDFVKAAAMGALGQIKEYSEEGIRAGDGEAEIIKRKIKIHDRTAALGMLLKLHGLLNDKPDAGDHPEVFTTDPALASATPPPGSIPALPQSGAVQDRASGASKRKDGDRKTSAGDGTVG